MIKITDNFIQSFRDVQGMPGKSLYNSQFTTGQKTWPLFKLPLFSQLHLQWRLAVVLHVVGIGDIKTHSADPRHQRAMNHWITENGCFFSMAKVSDSLLATNLRSKWSNVSYKKALPTSACLYCNMDRNWFSFANLLSKQNWNGCFTLTSFYPRFFQNKNINRSDITNY